MGGGGDREQAAVCKKLRELKGKFAPYVENGGVVLAVCGGFEILGEYYETADRKVEGVGILNITTACGKDRLIGNVVIESPLLGTTVVGFENHSGRVDIGSHTPLGRVVAGFGHDGKGLEGVVYKNVVATYLHGPLLPKNPVLADYIIARAIEGKYGTADLAPMDDAAELAAHNYAVGRFSGK